MSFSLKPFYGWFIGALAAYVGHTYPHFAPCTAVIASWLAHMFGVTLGGEMAKGAAATNASNGFKLS